MAARPILDAKDIDPKGYYTIWEKPQGKGMIWVIDRSYSGVFFRDNWDDFQRAWKRSRNDVVLVPKGSDPNKMKLAWSFPEELALYKDALEKMLRFYPEWVLGTVTKLVKQPDLLWLTQDLNDAVRGLNMSIPHLERLMGRDKNRRLEQMVPGATRALAQAEKAAGAVDDLAATLQDNPDRAARNIKKMLGIYVKALKPFYEATGLAHARVANMNRTAVVRITPQFYRAYGKYLGKKTGISAHEIVDMMEDGDIRARHHSGGLLLDIVVPEGAASLAKRIARELGGKVVKLEGTFSEDALGGSMAIYEMLMPDPTTVLKPLGLKTAAKWEGPLPKGWTDESRKKFWEDLTSRAPKHKVTECIKRMEGKVSNPGAFCASLADREIPGWRQEVAKEKAKKKGTTMTDPLLRKVAKLAYDNPDLRPKLMPIIREAQSTRVARPIELPTADVMLYMIDPRTNKSKFYEMEVVPAGDETRAKKDKDFSGGRPMYVLQKRWGRLKDSGQPGRVDSENDYFDNERDAIKAMRIWAGKKTSKGYQDVSRKREYPIGLGSAGFGWGGQAACQVIPELNFLDGAVEEALSALQYTDRKIAPIAEIDSSMAKKLKAMLTTAITDLRKVDQYLDEQLASCR